MLDQKQIFQVQNILETLVEATDHFSTLIRGKEFNQGIYIFSSIVEGSQAIISTLHSKSEDFMDETKNLEKYLTLIADELEKGQFIKVIEIIQFSLRPLLVRLQEALIEENGNKKTEKTISIGIFHSWINPREAYPKERLEATLNESIKQNTQLYFFTSDDVDFEKKEISADTFRNGEWKRVIVPFPDVINNIGAGRLSQTYRKLQRIIPFTTFGVGNKFTLPKRMLKLRKFAELLVPFAVCTSEESIYKFIEKNNHVVFKALGSNRGENIYFVNKKGSRYVILDQLKERILSEGEFQQFIARIILAEAGSYIVQRYIHTRTKADEPYHFRSHVQKNHNGDWQITHIYPRIGSVKSNLSNIATKGRVEDFPTFLRNEFGNKQGAVYEKKIRELSINVTKHLDKLYGMGLNELGLDFAIDDKGKVWMHEANNGAKTAYHEEKRAVNYIAYAKYIAKNGIMYIGQNEIEAVAKGQFQARNTDLPIFHNQTETSIGMLLAEQSNDQLSITLANTALENSIPFYSFTPKDVDYNFGLIRGSFYENGKWVQKIVEFPSVIIDRLKMRSVKKPMLIYEELENIPFTNEWAVDGTSRSTLFKSLQKNEKIATALAPYQTVGRALHVFQFLEEYGQVQLKQENMAYKYPVYTIRATKNNHYEVFQGTSMKKYSENNLRNYINHLIGKNNYIVQQHARLSSIHVLLFKNENSEWSTVYNHVESKTLNDDNTVTVVEQSPKTFITKNKLTNNLEKQIETLSINVLNDLEKELNKNISEAALSYVIVEDERLLLTEVNPNGPRIIKDNDSYADALIRYATNISAGTVKTN